MLFINPKITSNEVYEALLNLQQEYASLDLQYSRYYETKYLDFPRTSDSPLILRKELGLPGPRKVAKPIEDDLERLDTYIEEDLIRQIHLCE
jgi:hypothetical protein